MTDDVSNSAPRSAPDVSPNGAPDVAADGGSSGLRARVTRERAEVIATRRVGAHQHLTLVAPMVAELARAGQFVGVATGGSSSANLLPRPLAIHRVSPSGTYGGTIEVVVSGVGAGTRWITALAVHDAVDLVGPLGRAFPLPAEPLPCVLVGAGHGSAPLLWLAGVLRERGCAVEMVIAAPSEDRLFGVVDARRSCDAVTVATEDGSAGVAGSAQGVLPEVLQRSGAAVVYASGPVDLLKAVTTIAGRHGAVAQVVLEVPMTCGTGLCETCVVPVAGPDGATRMARTCIEGPVMRGDRVRWDGIAAHGAYTAYGASGSGGG